MATDNAVSALGKICEFQRDNIDSQVRTFFIFSSRMTCSSLHVCSHYVRTLASVNMSSIKVWQQKISMYDTDKERDGKIPIPYVY